MIRQCTIRNSQLLNFLRNFHSCKLQRLDLKTLVGNVSEDQVHVIERSMNHPPELFYEVVSDVSSYHKFVPYCKSSFISGRDAQGEPTKAGLRVSWRTFDEELVCQLQCQKSPETVSVVVAESVTHSLFDHLYTKWTIEPSPRANSCQAKLELQYKFKSALYNHMSSLFAESVSSLVFKAFEKRARDLRRERRT